jgi:hypothetical protein
MEREETEQSVCIDCGAIVYIEDEHCYLVSDDDALCFDCALRRGGQYDGVADEWVFGPDVSGLKSEQLPHA